MEKERKQVLDRRVVFQYHKYITFQTGHACKRRCERRKIAEVEKENCAKERRGICMDKTNSTVLAFRGIIIDPLKRKVIKDNTDASLTKKEFDILYFLAAHAGVVFSADRIYREIWKEEAVSSREVVTAHIAHIRKKIEQDPKHPFYIITVNKVGYKFFKD